MPDGHRGFIIVEHARDLEHATVLFMEPGIWQCLDCGYWTRVSREALDGVLCIEMPEDVPLERLEVTA